MASDVITDKTMAVDAAAYRAVELIYHSFLTGLILTLVTVRASRQRPRWFFARFATSNSRAFYPD